MTSADARKPLPKFKVVFLGDEATGKTSLIRRYMYDSFEEEVESTIGMDFQSKNINLEDGRQFRLQLWDTAGQERFRSLIPSYIRDAAAAAITYDVTNKSTFTACKKWLDEVRQQSSERCVLTLIGNKLDLASEKREVPISEGQRLAEEYGITFQETSAKSGQNVSSVFVQLAGALAKANPPAAGEVGGATTGNGAHTGQANGAPGGFKLGAEEQENKKDKGCKC
mmetsp:Transcript_24462/g.56332  ORF Transcript_24462/g.56332 Transcript_24462/m.56332 type:complete len:225 (+) Transcript_24462:79-753(+)